jgi:6-phosphogluconolactonase
MAITPNGAYVYADNSATSTVAGFSVGSNGALTPIAGTILSSEPAGSTNLDLAASGDGKFLYTQLRHRLRQHLQHQLQWNPEPAWK